MGLEKTPVSLKIPSVGGGTRSSGSTQQANIVIDPDKPEVPPYIEDKDGNRVFEWDSSRTKWKSVGNGSDIFYTPQGGLPISKDQVLQENESMFKDNTTVIINKLDDDQKSKWTEREYYKPYNEFYARQNNLDPEIKVGQQTEAKITTALTANDVSTILGKEDLIYPTKLSNNGQDYISFGMFEYQSKSFTQTSSAQSGSNSFNFKIGQRKTEISIGPKVYLPIQPTISDQNDIVWGEDRMTPIQAYFADKATTGNLGQIFNDFTAIDELVGNNSPYGKILRRWVGGQAVGINPIARTDGLVLNPNLELLFSGPSLRPFNFTFRLSPRDKDEAQTVKTIIKFFKLGSTVRTTNDGLFLKAPYVFNIQYHYQPIDEKGDPKKPEEHPGLNAIKTCALRSVNVNYTPDGSYMTFEDGTMTSYELSLQFMELEPVYDSDYKDKFKYENYQIGY